MTNRNTRRNQYQKSKKKTQAPLWIVLAGIVVIGAGLALGLTNNSLENENQTSGSGTPALVVDQELVDYGDVKLGIPVTTEFLVTNVGDGDLRFNEKPYVELKEGC